MGAPYNNLLSKLDRALMAFVVAGGAGTFSDVFPAKRSQTKGLPNTICYAEKGDEVGVGNPTRNCKASVMVRTSGAEDGAAAQTARLASEQRVAKTFDLFKTQTVVAGQLDTSGEDIATQITDAARALAIADPVNHGDLADFTALDVMDKGVAAGFDDDDAWVDTQHLEIVCAPGNVS
jgi:hypothetical protein